MFHKSSFIRLGLSMYPSPLLHPRLGLIVDDISTGCRVDFVKYRVYDKCMGPSVLAHRCHRTNLFGLGPFHSEAACSTTVILKSDIQGCKTFQRFQSHDVKHLAN